MSDLFVESERAGPWCAEVARDLQDEQTSRSTCSAAFLQSRDCQRINDPWCACTPWNQ